MTSTVDKIKGLGNQAAGNAKQSVGKVTGNERLQAEGKGQELKGKAQKTLGDAKDAVGDGADALKRKL